MVCRRTKELTRAREAGAGGASHLQPPRHAGMLHLAHWDCRALRREGVVVVLGEGSAVEGFPCPGPCAGRGWNLEGSAMAWRCSGIPACEGGICSLRPRTTAAASA